MHGYVDHAFIRFNHGTPRRAQGQPYQHTVTTYGARQQFSVDPDGTVLLDKEGKKFVQQVTVTLLYYARAVDSTMLVALSALASEQAIPTENTMKKVMLFLNYVASQDEAVMTYHASNMVLAYPSNDSYLSEPGACSCAGGNCFLSNDDTMPANNGAMLNIAQTIKAVMTSAAEEEIGAMFINAREAVPHQMTLINMGHPQPQQPCRQTILQRILLSLIMCNREEKKQRA